MINFDRILKLNNQFEYHLYAFASKKDLIEKFPEYERDLNKLNSKYIKWLDLRFGENPIIQEVHPIGNCIVTLLDFQNKDAGISQKYNNNPEFKNQIDEEFPLDKRKWSNPSDPMSMTIDEMERILVLHSRPKSKHTVEGLTKDPKDTFYTLPIEDFVAKVGSWNVWLPSSRENSCKIAGYDPMTLKPFTTWCTARTEGSNLFYHYVGADKMLFYIIKDNPTSDNDWLSVGFEYGEPIFRGNGTETVNRNNKKLTPESLQSILGGSYEAIMREMQNKNDSLSNKAPAQLKIEEAASDINKFKSLIRGNTEKEAKDLKSNIARITENEEILHILLQDDNDDINYQLSKNWNVKEKILDFLSRNSRSEAVQRSITVHPNASEKILEFLAVNGSDYVRLLIPTNENVNEKILDFLLKNSKDSEVQHQVMRRFSDKKLELLKQDIDEEISQLADYTLKERERSRLIRLREYGASQASYNSKINKLSRTVNLFYKTIQAISK